MRVVKKKYVPASSPNRAPAIPVGERRRSEAILDSYSGFRIDPSSYATRVTRNDRAKMRIQPRPKTKPIHLNGNRMHRMIPPHTCTKNAKNTYEPNHPHKRLQTFFQTDRSELVRTDRDAKRLKVRLAQSVERSTEDRKVGWSKHPVDKHNFFIAPLHSHHRCGRFHAIVDVVGAPRFVARRSNSVTCFPNTWSF